MKRSMHSADLFSNIESNRTCPFFGQPRDLPTSRIPTRADVLRCFKKNRLEHPFKDQDYIADKVTDKLISTWFGLFNQHLIKNKPDIKKKVKNLYSSLGPGTYRRELNLYQLALKFNTRIEALKLCKDYIDKSKAMPFDIFICGHSKNLPNYDSCKCETCINLSPVVLQTIYNLRHQKPIDYEALKNFTSDSKLHSIEDLVPAKKEMEQIEMKASSAENESII